MALNLRLLGKPGGEEEKGSNAGSKEGCRVRGARGTGALLECEFRGLELLGEDSMVVNCGMKSSEELFQTCNASGMPVLKAKVESSMRTREVLRQLEIRSQPCLGDMIRCD